MRSCDEIAELISASLDGQLTADEQTALEEHIARCPACSALLDDLRALHTAAADWEEVPAPDGFAASVMAAVAAESAAKQNDKVIPFPAKKAKRSHWKGWTVSAAAIAIVVLGAVSAPSLMGNFAAKDAAMEMDMSYARNDSLAECQMDTVMEEEVYYSVDADGSSVKAEAKPEMAPAAEPVPSTATSTAPRDPAEIPTASEPTDLTLYVGELLLEQPLDMLKQYSGAACSDGTVTYLVSADEFAEILKVLEAEKPVGYAYTAGVPDAQLGRIVVQSN